VDRVFPFAEVTPNMVPAEALSERYRQLHGLDERTYHDRRSGLTLLWRYDDVKEVLEAKTPGLTKKNSLDPLRGYGKIMANPLAAPPFLRHLVPPPAPATANNTDRELHGRIWGAMAGPDGWFRVPEPAVAWEGMARHFATAYENGCEESGLVDVSGVVAPKFSARVMTEWVGLPAESSGKVESWSRAQSGLLGRIYGSRREQAAAVSGLGNLFTVSKDIVRRRQREPAEDFASHLLARDIPARYVVAALANSLAAGVFTVSGTIEKTVRGLLSDPDRTHWRQLGDAARQRAISKEALRVFPGLVGWKAGASQPVTLRSGTQLRRGPILAMIEAANRDPRTFAAPDDFQPDRTGAQPLTFGQGAHICPGQWIARIGVQVFLAGLYERMPTAELAPVRPAVASPDLLFSGADVRIVAVAA
jgi:cytochrome P450